MAYLTQKITSAKSPRLCLANDLGRPIDGAWWPYSAVLADELSGLVTALDYRLGKVQRLSVNWSSRHNPPNLNWQDWRTKPQHIMTIDGSEARATLLIVPNSTNSTLASMVLRRAGGFEVDVQRGQEAMLANAEAILASARRQRK